MRPATQFPVVLKWLDRLFPVWMGVMALVVMWKFNHGPRRDLVLWSDAEGYYAHLPANFIYGHWQVGFDGEHLPVTNCCLIEEGKVKDRYNYGVAVLESPFFFAAHAYALSLGTEGGPPERYDAPTENPLARMMNQRQWSPTRGYATGFSDPYIYGILFASLFYGVLGLWLVKEVLKRKYNLMVSLITTLAIWIGTNLLYYAHAEAGMSHVYSFFLFAALLFLLPKWLEGPTLWRSTLLGLIIGLTILIRPTNIIVLALFAGYEVYSWRAIGSRIKWILGHYCHLIWMAMMVVAIFIPHLLYLKSAFGSYFAYSYGDEGFSYWWHPQTLKVWFSHQNGWFLYTPLAFAMVGGMIWQVRKKEGSALVMLFLFLAAGYIFGSWWTWWFGGAFGHRCYVEYYALFALPLAGVIHAIASHKIRWLKWAGAAVLLVLCYASLRFSLLYNYPWEGPDWTWEDYWGIWRRVF